MATPTQTLKKKCIVCEKEFDLTEYFLHVNEEILKQLMKVNETLTDIKDITELTYTYMQDDEETLDHLKEREKEIALSSTDGDENNLDDPPVQVEIETKTEVVIDDIKNVIVDEKEKESTPTRQHVSIGPKTQVLDETFYNIVQKVSANTQP